MEGGTTSDRGPEDAHLVRQLRSGDEAAFAMLVRRYGGRLLSSARRLLRNEEDARDAVQETFLGCFRSLDGFEGQSSIYTWMHRIMINRALMQLRSRRRKPETSIDDLLPRYYEDGHRIDPGPGWRETPQDELMRKETRQLVLDAIARLPDDYRNVLLLRDIEQLDTESTARVLEVAPGAVRVRLHRARQALRTALDRHFRSDA